MTLQQIIDEGERGPLTINALGWIMRAIVTLAKELQAMRRRDRAA